MKWHRWAAAAVLLACLPVWAAAQEEFVSEFPPALRFTQKLEVQEIRKFIYIKCTYPDTAQDAVDEEMRELIDRMLARNKPNLPLQEATCPSYLDVGAAVSRSGDSVLSFLTMAEISREKKRLSVEYETRVYDMEDGRRLSLSDFIREDSAAYAYIAQEIRAQLSAAFPGMEPDADALEALLTEEAIRNAPFTLSAARMTLTYRADLLYPGKPSLLHVHLYYPQLRSMMTDYGLRQTDNSRYRMVALTYDDGGARSITRGVLDHLRNYGAQATFFVVGQRCLRNEDTLLCQQDGKHSIQDHSYSHDYSGKRADIFQEKQKMVEILGGITGVVPTMMRAPGGNYKSYVSNEIGYPLIQWSLASGDSGNPHYDQIADRVIHNAKDGSVILMHDLNSGSPIYTEEIMRSFAERGILCVTVEELFSDAGVELEANQVYRNPYILVE